MPKDVVCFDCLNAIVFLPIALIVFLLLLFALLGSLGLFTTCTEVLSWFTRMVNDSFFLFRLQMGRIMSLWSLFLIPSPLSSRKLIQQKRVSFMRLQLIIIIIMLVLLPFITHISLAKLSTCPRSLILNVLVLQC